MGHCDCEGNRAGGRAGKGKSTPNAISHAVEKRYSRVRLARKSPPGIFAAGHLRARRSPPPGSGENWEHVAAVYVSVHMYMCLHVRMRARRVCAECQGYGGYFGIGAGEGSEGEIPEID